MPKDTGWGSREFADAWKKSAEARARVMAAPTERMLDEARLRPGAQVLDLGTGGGDTAVLAAERVRPGGTVLGTDASPAMIDTAQDAVRAAGAHEVTVRVMDACAIDLPDASFDAVIARQVLMFLDRPRALGGIRRVLRQGGRFAAVVWGPLARNPFHRLVVDAARARQTEWLPHLPEVMRAFSEQDPDAWRRALEQAGFADVAIHPVAISRHFETAEQAFEAIRSSPIHSEPILRLADPAVREDAWREVEAGCRAFSGDFPGETLVVVGEAR